MIPFRKSPQHNSSTSTALDNTSILDDDVKSPLIPGLKTIANIEDQISRIQNKVEHPTLYCTEKDREAGRALSQNMHHNLKEWVEVLRNIDIENKIENIRYEVDHYKKMHEDMLSKHKKVEEIMIEHGYVPQVRRPILTDGRVNDIVIPENISFIIDRKTNATEIVVLPPSPILHLSFEQDDAAAEIVAPLGNDESILDVVAPLAATPEIFRKLSKHQSRLGAEHIKAVMQNTNDNTIDITRNEPTRNIQMTLAGPIRAERQIPPPLSESPKCIREFKFSITPEQIVNRSMEMCVDALRDGPQSINSFANELEEDPSIICDPITESQYNNLPSFISKNITHIELNRILICFTKKSQECNVLRDIGQLSEQEMAKEVESASQLSLIKLALKKLKRIHSIGEDKNYFIIC